MILTTKQYLERLEKLRNQLSSEKPLAIAAFDTTDAYHTRIFIDGKKTDGSKIQYISDNPVYINSVDGSPQKLSGAGKTGKSNFKNGKKHKSTYFESYKAFKAKIGRPIMELFGELQSSVANGVKKLDDNTYVIAISQKESDKVSGLQHGNGRWQGFGTIFKFTKSERKIFTDTFAREMKKQFEGNASENS